MTNIAQNLTINGKGDSKLGLQVVSAVESNELWRHFVAHSLLTAEAQGSNPVICNLVNLTTRQKYYIRRNLRKIGPEWPFYIKSRFPGTECARAKKSSSLDAKKSASKILN